MSIEFNKYYIVIIWILYSNISLIQYKKIKINCFNGALKIHSLLFISYGLCNFKKPNTNQFY